MMVQEPGEVVLRGDERKRQCKRCRLWGRTSLDHKRSDYGRGGVSTAGRMAYRSHCRECTNAQKRARKLATVGKKRDFSNDRDVMDDLGTLIQLRLCSVCRSWLPRSAEHFDRRGHARGGTLTTFCKPCRRDRQRRDYETHREVRKQRMRDYHRQKADERAMDRAIAAYDAGRPCHGRIQRRIGALDGGDPFLPVEPLRAWLTETIARLDRELAFEGKLVNGGGSSLLAAMAAARRTSTRTENAWARALYRWRFESSVVRESDADELLVAASDDVALDDLWPDRDAALAEAAARQVAATAAGLKSANARRRQQQPRELAAA